METLHSDEIIRFLLAITLMLSFGRFFGEIFRKLKQAAVVGEIIAGVLLGPTIFGALLPDAYTWIFPESGAVAISLEAIVNLSIIFLLLVVGFEIDLSVILKQGKAAIIITLFGMSIPFILGGGFTYNFYSLFKVESNPEIFSFFIATALAISALPIIARTLMDLKLFNTPLGFTIIASAMLNDFIGWIVFSVFLSISGSEGHSLPFYYTIIYTLGFVFITLIIIRKLFHYAIPYIQSKTNWPGGILSFMMITALIGAAITEFIGVHSIFGAFIMGIALGDSVHLNEKTKDIVNQFITNIFAPLFFVSIGIHINFIKSFDPLIVSIILALAFLGKILGSYIGGKFSGFDNRDSLAIGFSMNARGVLEIVLSLVALNAKIISTEIFIGIIVLVLLSSILSAPLVALVKRSSSSYSLMDLLDSKSIVFGNANDKYDAIKILTEKTAKRFKLNNTEVEEAVIKRENLIPTGISNGLAIPHAKIEISKPICSLLINKNGIDFEATDKIKSKIIILLLTPKNNNQLQLQLLAEIASLFSEEGNVEKLLTAKNSHELISLLKQIYN